MYLHLAPWDSYWITIFRKSGKILPPVNPGAHAEGPEEYFRAYKHAYDSIVVQFSGMQDAITWALHCFIFCVGI